MFEFCFKTPLPISDEYRVWGGVVFGDTKRQAKDRLKRHCGRCGGTITRFQELQTNNIEPSVIGVMQPWEG